MTRIMDKYGFSTALLLLIGSFVAAQNDDPNTITPPKLYHIHEAIQRDLSSQVGRELHASIQYLAIASYFGQDDVSLLGFKKFFMENSDEEKGHANKLVNYLNERNGKLGHVNVQMPIHYKGSSGLQALKDALALENDVTKHLMHIHEKANNEMYKDVHLIDMLESDMLREQVEATRNLEGMISKLTKMSNEGNAGLAEYLFDLELQKKA